MCVPKVYICVLNMYMCVPYVGKSKKSLKKVLTYKKELCIIKNVLGRQALNLKKNRNRSEIRKWQGDQYQQK